MRTTAEEVALLVEGRRYDDAVRRATTWLASNPEDGVVMGLLARAYLNAGDQRSALDTALRAMALAPLDPDVQETRGLALHNLKRDAEATAVARWYVGQRPDSWTGWRMLAICSGDPREAIAAGERAVALAPQSSQAHRALGAALLRAKLNEEAERCFRDALRIRPDDAEARNLLGVAVLRQGRAASAAAGFRSALRLDPRAGAARSNLLVALQVAVRPFVLAVWLTALAFVYVVSGLSTPVVRLCGVVGGTVLLVLLAGCSTWFFGELPGGLRTYGTLLRRDLRLLTGLAFLLVAVVLIWLVAVVPDRVGALAVLAALTALVGNVLFLRGARWRPWWWPRR